MRNAPRHVPPRCLPLAKNKPRRVVKRDDRARAIILGRHPHLQVHRTAFVGRAFEARIDRLPRLDRSPRCCDELRSNLS